MSEESKDVSKTISNIMEALKNKHKRKLDEARNEVAKKLEILEKRIVRDSRKLKSNQHRGFSIADQIKARREARSLANVLPEIVMSDEELSDEELSDEELSDEELSEEELPPLEGLSEDYLPPREDLPLQEQLTEDEFPEQDLIVDGSILLEDVINGHYTMEDISIAQGGSIKSQDPAERSALQLFDNIVKYSMKSTKNILQPSDDPRQFFQSIQQSGIDIENMRPVQLDQCVQSAATAIDLMSYTRIEPNEVMDACECLIKAQLMYEAEVNLRKVAEISDWKRLQIHLYRKEQEEKMKKHDEAIALLGVRPVLDETLSKESKEYKEAASAEAKWLKDQERCEKLRQSAYGTQQNNPNENYDICMKYDVSLLPSDDPNVYKPLEVMCYMGLVRPKQ